MFVAFFAFVVLAALLVNGATISAPSGTWVPAGTMSQPRDGASAALLKDGRVLIMGGSGQGGETTSAELLDAGGSFSPAASMNIPRSRHISVVLSDGRVLVAGGSTSGGGVTNSAELYDPAANSWSDVAGGMTEARAGHTASLLGDGRVLIAGGENGGTISQSVEIFDPLANSFTFAGALSSPRKNHAAAVLADGRVLIIGGSDGSNVLASSDIYDPTSASVSAGPALALPRAGHSATSLLNGNVLVAGGNNGADDVASAELYDATTSVFSPSASSLSAPRRDHLAFLLPNNNSVLIVGGTSAGTALASAELYVPWTGAFQATASLSDARTGAAGSAMQQDGVMLIAGGSGLSSSDLYGFATVKTDKNDYAPGEIVTVSGSGWQPGETVTLTYVESPLVDTHGPYTVVADSFGNIFAQQFIPDAHDADIHFYLTASGASSQAQSTFTDAVPCCRLGSVVAGSQVGTLTAGTPGSVTFPVTVNRGTSAGPVSTVLSVVSGLPAGATFSFPSTCSFTNPITHVTTISPSCLRLLATDNSLTTTLVVTTSASTPGGSFTLTIKGYDEDLGPGTGTTTTTTLIIDRLGSIAGTVFTDSNTNSVLDGGEPGLGGVTVTLTDCSNNAVGTTSTAANGTYAFSGLAAGCYKVSSPATANGEALETASPLTANLAAGQNSTGNNFGYTTGGIGDSVWNDLNGNGVQDAGEPGLSGVTVTLKDSGNNVVGTQTTGANGIYTFTGLTAGSYTVCTSGVAAGFVQTFDLDGLGTPNCATASLAAGQSRTDVDFGYQQRNASIGDRVWNDLNGNGVQDGAEPGLVGVTVTLKDSGNNVVGTQTTGANGIYTFTGLTASSYTVCTSGVAAGFVQTFDLDGLGTPNCATASLAAGQNRTDADFGYRVTPLQLSCPSGTTGQAGVPYSSTAAFSGGVGPYVFSVASGSLPPGLTLNPATGAITGTPTAGGTFVFTLMVTDSLGSTAISTCSGSCSSTSIMWDFATPSGLLGTSASYTVSGVSVTAYGFSNAGAPKALYGNNRGFDESGLGINGTAADNEIDTANFVQLDLNNLINRGATNLQMTVESVQATEAYNVYGSNTLGVIGTALITNSTVDNTAFTVPQFGLYRYVSVRATALDVLLGAISATLPPGCTITITGFGSIAGTVYTDTNTNSVLDNGEPGIGGVTVTLNGPGGTKTTTTASNGTYLFSNLVGGSYTVSSPSTANGQTLETTSPLSVALAPGQNKTGVNFGYISPFCTPTTTTIVNDFNSYSIGSGKTLWFSSELNPSGTITKLTHISVTNASIVFTVGTTNYTIPVPNALITLDPAATTATTTFDTATQTWKTTVPANISGDIFMAGVALPLPNGLPGGVDDVSWSAQMSADSPGVTVVWKWSATAFSSFNTNYNSLGVKPVDDSTKSVYKNSDTSGTPENYKNNTVSGGIGTSTTCHKTHVITASVALCKTNSCKYTTYTQGFWHNTNGLNLLNLGWSSVYGSNVKIGGNKTLTFTNPSYTSRFLPQGGTPGYLTSSSTNPTSSSANVFGGQVLTLQLNVDYSAAGMTNPGLVNLKFNYGPLAGYNVGQILAIANAVMGGNLAALPPGVSISALNDAVDKINNNFDGGTVNNGFLF